MKIVLIIVGILLGLFVIYFIINMIVYKKRMKNYDESDENSKVIKLNESNFSSSIQKGVVLVDFWATWCKPCIMIAPIIRDLADDMDGKAKICKLDIDKNKKVAQKLRVRSIPTLIIFKNGKEVDRIVGVKPKRALIKSIEKYL